MLATQSTKQVVFHPGPAPQPLPQVRASKTFRHTIDIYLKDNLP